MKKAAVLSLIVLLSLALMSGFAYAVSGRCDNCHTMHNSQNGAPMNFDNSATPNPALLRGNCIGCHTGTNTGTSTVPYVNSTSAPTYDTNTLAGGNFYWAQSDATTGHNVVGIGTINLNTPPGYDGGRSDINGKTPGGGTWPSGVLNCAGANGCHGKHDAGFNEMSGVSGAHHSNQGGALTTANTVGNSYRFLIGIHGNEDSDWEYTKSDNSTDHNQYKGVARTTTDLNDKTTISWLCGECHGQFHTKASDVGAGSPWLRHPTDLSLNDVTGTEYAAYNGATAPASAPYSVQAPVASVDVTNKLATVDVTKGNSTDNAIVTCISCHRAHGTPYADLLRWDYSGMLAGGGGATGTGCFKCHTSKD